MNLGCVIVTGASSGIGAATALAHASRGMQVVVAARSPHRLLERVDDDLVPLLEPFPGDLTRPEGVERLFSHAVETYGRVSKVVHSVGCEHPVGWFRDRTPEEVATIITALLTSPALVLNRALATLADGGGTIGLVSSGAASRATPGRALYSASKIAVERLVEATATECATVQPATAVLGIIPGRVDTPMQDALMEAAAEAPEAFRLAAFSSSDGVAPAEKVGAAIADLMARSVSELNGTMFRYRPDGWTAAT